MEDKKSQKQAQIERIINESFLKPFLDDEGITDISWDGTELRLKHNQRDLSQQIGSRMRQKQGH